MSSANYPNHSAPHFAYPDEPQGGGSAPVTLPDPTRNLLYFGDNLEILQRHIASESVDLVYLDPPFNSNRDYNVLFKEQSGQDSQAQIKAFGDTWRWTAEVQALWEDFSTVCPSARVRDLLAGIMAMLAKPGSKGHNDLTAYLVMMAPRLWHLHRVLKPTGSLYLHCDPTASHYLKLVTDAIFSPANFGNEIIWQRTNAKGLAFTRFARNHDIILRYVKNVGQGVWHPQYTNHDPGYVEQFYKYVEPDTGRRYRLADLTNPNKDRPNLTYEFLGVTRVWRWTKQRMEKAYADGIVVQTKAGGVPALKRYLDEQEGNPVGDTWMDILPVQAQAAERLGYPTQKPVALLKRILAASSNEGDTILDPFAGCGTTISAAQAMNRRWIGIDITPIATTLIQKRLFDESGGVVRDIRIVSKDSAASEAQRRQAFRLYGLPTDVAGARALYERDPLHKDFEMWAVGLVPAIPQEKKGADGGVDGVFYIADSAKAPSKGIVQVKGGHVTRAQIDQLKGAMDGNKAVLGFFVTLEEPTAPMLDEAIRAGTYRPPSGAGKAVPRVQIRTIGDLLNGRLFELPLYGSNVSYTTAQISAVEAGQEELEL